MGYIIQTVESVEAYIRELQGLSEDGKWRVTERYVRDLSEDANHFLKSYPLEHESYKFQYEYALIDGGVIYSFRFIADGTYMPMGVVRVVFVDHEAIAIP